MGSINRTVTAMGLAGLMMGGAHANPFKPSIKDQITLGQRAAKEVRQKEKVLPNTDPRTRMVRRIATRLLNTITVKNEPWEYSFDVIDSKEMNAFALPGGPTFFYTGLIDKLSTEDEIAAVIGHELAHVRKQHWANAYADSQTRGLGITALLMIFNAGRTAYDIAGITNELVFNLPYSRRNETDSDNEGIEMMVKAGFNPYGMSSVFSILGKQGGKPPEFLSTHPGDKNRVKNIETRISKMKKTWSPPTPLPGKTPTYGTS